MSSWEFNCIEMTSHATYEHYEALCTFHSWPTVDYVSLSPQFVHLWAHILHRHSGWYSIGVRLLNKFVLNERSPMLVGRSSEYEVNDSVNALLVQNFLFVFTCSLWRSSAEVASSRSKIFGFLSRARAMAIRCFWPPDSCVFLLPRFVLYPFGIQIQTLLVFSVEGVEYYQW